MSPTGLRYGGRDSYWNGKRIPFVKGICLVFLLLQVLFLGNLAYLYGVLYDSGHRTSGLHILEVNLDTAASSVQGAILAACNTLKGNNFPSLIVSPSSEYRSIEAARSAVCQSKYWAAVVVSNGASSRLSNALAGGTSADTYNSSDAVTLIYNSARYTSVALGDIIGNLDTLVITASAEWSIVDPTAIRRLDTTSAAAVYTFRNPISWTTLDIMPTNQGPRVLYNTVSMVMPIIQQFFFLMALNGISSTYKFYSSLRMSSAIGMRTMLSTTYTFISSLAMTGYIWAYREDWSVSANQFALTWMVIWLYMFVHFVVIDSATAFIPMSFLPFFLITWVIFNISSTLYPFELTAGFYRWGYALPAVNTYQLLVDIWSDGCEPVVHRALPILFAWAVAGILLANIAMYKRCRAASKAEAAEELMMTEKLKVLNGSVEHNKPPRMALGADESSDVLDELERQATARETRPADTLVSIRLPFADAIEGLAAPGTRSQ